MRIALLAISVLMFLIGLYLKYVYDVPDGQEAINFFTSGFLMIVGVSGILINAFWRTPRPPTGDQE